jgi:hypothetical protein
LHLVFAEAKGIHKDFAKALEQAMFQDSTISEFLFE